MVDRERSWAAARSKGHSENSTERSVELLWQSSFSLSRAPLTGVAVAGTPDRGEESRCRELWRGDSEMASGQVGQRLG